MSEALPDLWPADKAECLNGKQTYSLLRKQPAIRAARLTAFHTTSARLSTLPPVSHTTSARLQTMLPASHTTSARLPAMKPEPDRGPV